MRDRSIILTEQGYLQETVTEAAWSRAAEQGDLATYLVLGLQLGYADRHLVEWWNARRRTDHLVPADVHNRLASRGHLSRCNPQPLTVRESLGRRAWFARCQACGGRLRNVREDGVFGGTFVYICLICQTRRSFGDGA